MPSFGPSPSSRASTPLSSSGLPPPLLQVAGPLAALTCASSALSPPSPQIPREEWSGVIESGIRAAQGLGWDQLREAFAGASRLPASYTAVRRPVVGSSAAAAALAQLNRLFVGWLTRTLCPLMDPYQPLQAQHYPSDYLEAMDIDTEPAPEAPAPSTALSGPEGREAPVTRGVRQFGGGRAPPHRTASPGGAITLPHTLPPSHKDLLTDPIPRDTGAEDPVDTASEAFKAAKLPTGFNRGFIFNYSQATMTQVSIFI